MKKLIVIILLLFASVAAAGGPTDTTITHAAIEHDHSIAIDFDTTDTPEYVQMAITGWFNADVD